MAYHRVKGWSELTKVRGRDPSEGDANVHVGSIQAVTRPGHSSESITMTPFD